MRSQLRLKALIEVDGVQTVLSDREYVTDTLTWLMIESAKVDSMVKLNKMIPAGRPIGVNYS